MALYPSGKVHVENTAISDGNESDIPWMCK
jgi:hypothetical protein